MEESSYFNNLVSHRSSSCHNNPAMVQAQAQHTGMALHSYLLDLETSM